MPTQPDRSTPEKPPLPSVIVAKEEARKQHGIRVRFANFSAAASAVVGSSAAFLIALVILVLWAVTGPYYHYSDTWQLVINTGTSVITFLMVFLIQNTQNRDAKAIHLKLNELIHAGKHAQNELIEIEKLSDEELKKLEEYYARIRKECERRRAESGTSTAASGSDSSEAA